MTKEKPQPAFSATYAQATTILLGITAIAAFFGTVGWVNNSDKAAREAIIKRIPPENQHMLQARLAEFSKVFEKLSPEEQQAFSLQKFHLSAEQFKTALASTNDLLQEVVTNAPDTKTFTTNPPSGSYVKKLADTNVSDITSPER